VTNFLPVVTQSGLSISADGNSIVILPAIRYRDQLYVTLILSGSEATDHAKSSISVALEARDASILPPVSQGASGEPGLIRCNIVFASLSGMTSNYVLTIRGPLFLDGTRIALNKM
jgi:hypothetical protein